MNYEFTIRRLEAELAHVREMEAINRDHVLTLDEGHKYTGDRLARIEASLESVTSDLKIIAVDLKTLTGNMDRLVKALLREHPNGGEQKPT
jgi:hypothetical protein